MSSLAISASKEVVFLPDVRGRKENPVAGFAEDRFPAVTSMPAVFQVFIFYKHFRTGKPFCVIKDTCRVVAGLCGIRLDKESQVSVVLTDDG